MGKVSAEARKKYLDRINAYKEKAEEILKKEAIVLQVLEKDDTGQQYKQIRLADANLNLASYYLIMNDLSKAMLGVKNESFLNNARKTCYKVIIYLEKVVTSLLDVPFADYEKELEAISGFDPAQRYGLMNKLGFTIQSVVEGFGDNSKWKWSFVELEGRMAVVCKNFINLKTLFTDLDPRSPNYELLSSHFNLTKRLLEGAANRYREKYELSTMRFEDFRLAINFLGALKRMYTLLNQGKDADAIKKKMDIWQAKLEGDMKKKGAS
jgi:hypothetical protein